MNEVARKTLEAEAQRTLEDLEDAQRNLLYANQAQVNAQDYVDALIAKHKALTQALEEG